MENVEENARALDNPSANPISDKEKNQKERTEKGNGQRIELRIFPGTRLHFLPQGLYKFGGHQG